MKPKNNESSLKPLRLDVVWAENRDEIFLNRLAEDISKLQQVGFCNEDILKMLGALAYVRSWVAWPSWAFPVAKLPKGYKWSDAAKYKRKAGTHIEGIVYYFLPVGDDLYIKQGRGSIKMIGLDIRDRAFLKILNYQKLAINEVLLKLDLGAFFNTSIVDFWGNNHLPLGYVESILRDL